jgi:3-hydroxyisobutyrate dehydrogenase-like beta-hydroxyacid dehydrogenase
MTKVAFLGLGAMGSRMAPHLLDAGHELVVWNRSPEKAAPLVERGATLAGSPAEAARDADVVITMLADPPALSAVVDGLASGMSAGQALIDMSTVGPATVAETQAKLPQGTKLLDAPVLGSLPEAEAGELRIFVGGPDDLVEKWMPLLSAMGSPVHVGPLGSGQKAKLVANSTLFGVIGVLGEVVALGDALGLSREATFDVLAATPVATQAERRRGPIESGDYPRRFALALARKDSDLASAAVEGKDVDLRVLDAARSWLVEAQDAGWGDRDYSEVLARILGSR